MKDAVDAGIVWQAETVGDGANPFHHLKQPGKTWTELVALAKNQGLRQAMKEAQSDPVIDGELWRPMVVVVVLLGVSLSLEQPVTYVGQECVPVLEEAIHSVRAHRTYSVRQQCRRRPPVYHLE
jgi:hypothetical protein